MQICTRLAQFGRLVRQVFFQNGLRLLQHLFQRPGCIELLGLVREPALQHRQGLAQRRFQRLGHGDLNKGDHDAVDAIVLRAVRHDAHREPAPVAGGDLSLVEGERPQHLTRVVSQSGIVQLADKVGDGPAGVAGN